ncbi:MAG: pyridoxal phosphate-dependent aminotransferase [Spirochaetes bacterium]|nr:pyridoxal phosphate-dependent aminotransferase [Spirochaetota bacterium]MBN2772115.1 pyridoxal phosphate-dependent aminotransferase [Spirochaetota bacterium]
MELKKSSKLDNVFYDIRGPVLEAADRMIREGHTIIKLNTGNPAAFGITAPDEIVQDVKRNLMDAQPYGDSKGLYSARKAVMQDCQLKGIKDVDVDDIYIGNGVSELIVMSMQGLLNNGDEVLVPIPDYPLWTGAVNLAGGTAVHYVCDEKSKWYPDIDDIRSKVSNRTKAIIIINPNNPTGAVYPKELIEQIIAIAAENKLVVIADEIYDRILYDDACHYSAASLSDEVLFLTMNGLSKSHRICGFRTGWMIVSGNRTRAKDFIEGLEMLSSMRLCSNMPSQYAIQTALGGYQSLNELISPGGRLYEQREYAHKIFNSIPGVSSVKPDGAIYLFPKIDVKKYNISDDRKFVLDFLVQKKILLVQGTGFNWPDPDHFRVVFLPSVDDLKLVADRFADFLSTYRQD